MGSASSVILVVLVDVILFVTASLRASNFGEVIEYIASSLGDGLSEERDVQKRIVDDSLGNDEESHKK